MKKYPKLIMQILIICFMVLCVHSVTVLAEENQLGAAGLSKEEALLLRERIYREGILPSGKPVEATAKEDITLEGSMFSCQSCHMRAGLGSFEGGIFSPPTNGANLFKPFRNYSTQRNEATPFLPQQIVDFNQNLFQRYTHKPLSCPVYTDASLAEVIRYGDDTTGRIINDVMPRYLLEDNDMALLVSYLKSLSSDFSPVVSDMTLRFATVITDDVSPEERNALLVPLENFVKNKNQAN